ncbi:hypothetical protein NDU88_007362 [Pleurodeles waltl]|uniref:Uncharacterized protein n=1 Tax=Pleurodeles waltl TaxID=8319 RepID=A0AAV7UNL4_PLEWA|nr:hypothetical protein NDU88_007362 [Pleurodeles waltl]
MRPGEDQPKRGPVRLIRARKRQLTKGGGQAGVNGGCELSELRVSPGLSNATRGFGGWRRLVEGGDGQLWRPGPWRDWAPAPKSSTEQNQAGPTWIHGPPGSGERRPQTCRSARAWHSRAWPQEPAWRGGPWRDSAPLEEKRSPRKLQAYGGGAGLPHGALRRWGGRARRPRGLDCWLAPDCRV